MPRTRRTTPPADVSHLGHHETLALEAELRAELLDLHTRADEADDLTDAEWRRAGQLLDQLQAVQAKADRYRHLVREVEAGRDLPVDGARDFQHQRRTDWHVEADRVGRIEPREARDRALALIEARGAHLSDVQRAGLDRLVRTDEQDCDGSYIARRALVTESDAYRAAFSRVMTQQRPVLTGAEADALRALELLDREMNITTSAEGGFGVPVMIDPTILVTNQGSENPFLAAGAEVKTITTKDWRGVSAAGVTWAFETESAAANDISPTLTQPTIHAHKAQGFIPFTIEVGMDYPDFASEMAKVLGMGYGELLVDKFTRGSGTGEPWGIFEACENATSQVTVTTDGTFTAHDVLSVWKQLPNRFRGRASWIMNIDVNNEIRAFGDDRLSQQTVNLAAPAADRILGRPAFESPYAPEFTGTTGAASILVVGDFSNFYIAQRAGMTVEYVPHLFDTSTGTPIGQRGWYAWTRVGSDAAIDNSFRMLVNS